MTSDDSSSRHRVASSGSTGQRETAKLLTDRRAIAAIRAGEMARRKGQKDHYTDWELIRKKTRVHPIP